jgi:outer membrane protein OmpA-like peptidoglycan-associated protein
MNLAFGELAVTQIIFNKSQGDKIMFQIQKISKIALMIAVLVCTTSLFVVNAAGQELLKSVGSNDVKTVLFKQVDETMTAAKKAQADVLAPKNFGEAMTRYREAESDLRKGKELADIKKKLRESNAYFQKAIDATKLAEVTFPNSMKARKDAQATESAKFSSKLWTEAEEKFNEGAGKLEDGDVNNAREKAGEAEKLYRKAELAAIKANYLDETRNLLKQAEKMDVEDRAPKTLKLAEQLVKQAEKELNENRYDTDVARGQARQANYEVKHAIYLSKTIKEMKDKDLSWEDLMLASEKPLMMIGEQADIEASFDAGLGKTTNDIIAYVSTYNDSVSALNQQLDWYEQDDDLQQQRIAELEKQLGSQTKEKSSLAQQIEQQAKTHAIFANVEKSFNRDEASVLREGNDIIIRLVGLNFPSAAATIEQKSFGLLTKVRDAINAFPGSTVSVLGHTDSYGSDEKNLTLSKERAEAVKEYLLASTTPVTSQIEATGYGESKPIASNETKDGRTANRRVEIIIHPGMVGGTF